jgi:hypothetical protein
MQSRQGRFPSKNIWIETVGWQDQSEQASFSDLLLFESDEEALIKNQGSNMSISTS